MPWSQIEPGYPHSQYWSWELWQNIFCWWLYNTHKNLIQRDMAWIDMHCAQRCHWANYRLYADSRDLGSYGWIIFTDDCMMLTEISFKHGYDISYDLITKRVWCISISVLSGIVGLIPMNNIDFINWTHGICIYLIISTVQIFCQRYSTWDHTCSGKHMILATRWYDCVFDLLQEKLKQPK